MQKGTLIFLFSIFSIFIVDAQNTLLIYKEKNKFGIRENSKWILKPRYDSIIKISDECFITNIGNLYGIFRKKMGFNLKTIRYTGCKYEQFKCNSDNYIDFTLRNKKSGFFAIYNHRGEQLTEFEFENIALTDNVFCRKPGEKWRLYNTTTRTYTIDFYADSISVINEQNAIGFTGKHSDGRYDTITYVYWICLYLEYNPDWGKKKIIAESIEIMNGFTKKYFVNENGLIISEGYYILEKWPDSLFLVKSHTGKYGLRDSTFNVILPEVFDDIQKVANYCIVKKDRNQIMVYQRKLQNNSLYDLKKRTFVLYEVDSIRSLWDGAFAYKKGNADIIYFPDVGKEYNIYWFTTEMLIVQYEQNKFQLYKKNGEPMSTPIFYYYNLYNDNLILYVEQKNSKKIKYKVSLDGNFFLVPEK